MHWLMNTNPIIGQLATGAAGSCALSGEAQMHRARCNHAERILGWYENHVAPCEVKACEASRFLAFDRDMSLEELSSA